jgi:hypothetical protein
LEICPVLLAAQQLGVFVRSKIVKTARIISQRVNDSAIGAEDFTDGAWNLRSGNPFFALGIKPDEPFTIRLV